MNKYLKWGVILFELVLIISLIQGIIKSRQRRSRVGELGQVRNELVEERKKLLKRLEYVQSRDYLEKIAREELGWAKKNEVVIIPDMDNSKTVVENEVKPTQKTKWQEWQDKWLSWLWR